MYGTDQSPVCCDGFSFINMVLEIGGLTTKRSKAHSQVCSDAPLYSQKLQSESPRRKGNHVSRCAQLNFIASLEASCCAFSAYTGSHKGQLGSWVSGMTLLTLGIANIRPPPRPNHDRGLEMQHWDYGKY
jgi:hypothetical protein